MDRGSPGEWKTVKLREAEARTASVMVRAKPFALGLRLV